MLSMDADFVIIWQPHEQAAMKIFTKLVRWTIFGVVFALLPFALNWWHMWTASGSNPWYVYQLWPRGELLLVSVAIAADAIGDLVGSGGSLLIFKLIACGGCVLALFIAAAWFSQSQFALNPNSIKISNASMCVFMLTIISGGACKALAEM